MADEDVVVRLRGAASDSKVPDYAAGIAIDGAAEIVSLRAQVERMREALEPFARVKDCADRPADETVMVVRSIRPDENARRRAKGRPPFGEDAREIVSFDGLNIGHFRAARAALTPSAPTVVESAAPAKDPARTTA